MKKFLQKLSFKDQNYNRVKQKYICSKKPNEASCEFGPDSQGKCQHHYVCKPIKKDNKFICTRSKENGGKCEHGPDNKGSCAIPIMPCNPKLNLAYQRAMVSKIVVLVCLAIVLLLLSTKFIKASLNPGALSSNHAFITNCSDCHTNFSNNLVNLFDFNSFTKQSDISCTKCHNSFQHEFKAHNLEADTLKNITNNIKADNSIKSIVDVFYNLPLEKSSMPCQNCHKEHKGATNVITATDDLTCNICHKSRFKNFKLHSNFKKYPSFNNTSRINYDHIAHETDYFVKEQYKDYANLACSSCHKTDMLDKNMQVLSFEATCKSCHENDILGVNQTNKALKIINIGNLDIDTLKQNGYGVGSWPLYADDNFSPIMLMLLKDQVGLKFDFNNIKELSFDDLSLANKFELESVANIVWSIKEMLYDLEHEGLNALAVKSDTLKVLSLDAPNEDTIRVAINNWFDNLDREVIAHRADKFVASEFYEQTSNPTTTRLERYKTTAADFAKHGGWFWEDYALFYAPRMHNDNLMQSLILSSVAAFKAVPNKSNRDAFHLLTDLNAPGRCLKCHKLFQLDGEYKLEFKAHKKLSKLNFTKFFHGPHVNTLEDNCNDCHKYNHNNNYAESFNELDLAKISSSFNNIEINDCNSCHNSDMVKDNCTTCHQYHQ